MSEPWNLKPGVPYDGPIGGPQALLEGLKQQMVPGNVINHSYVIKGIVEVLDAMLGPQTLVFDDADSARAHVVREHRGLEEHTTRELLAELRIRAENWAGADGSDWLADNVKLCMVTLGQMMLDGRREP